MKWDKTDRRYEDDRGRPLTPAEVRKHITDFIESEKRSVKAESEKLFARTITLAAFFAFMRQKVTGWHGIAGVIAYGGEDEMDGERWKRINEKILSELEYLNNFAEAAEHSFTAAEAIADDVARSVPPELGPLVRESVADALLLAAPSEAESIARKAVEEVLTGTVENAAIVAGAVTVGTIAASLLIGGTVESRAASYTDAVWATHETQTLERERDNGVTHGRRICEKDGASCDECVDAATDEFIPLDEIEDIGSLQCLNSCRCELEFGDQDSSFLTSDLFSGRVAGQEAFGGDVDLN